MRLLALDSSGMVASVAILTEETVLAEYTVNYKKTHSQTLLPMVDEIVRMIGQDLSELDAIAVAAGPGSFTGLRIGSATAKGLGMALGLPLISVPTLEGLAYHYYGTGKLVCPMMDARRQQVYTGLYTWKGDSFRILIPQTACPVDDIIEQCIRTASEEKREILFLGDGVPVYQEVILDKMGASDLSWSLAPPHMNRQRAACVGARGLALFKEGKWETADQHAPVYLRKSQAERELEKKGKSLEE